MFLNYWKLYPSCKIKKNSKVTLFYFYSRRNIESITLGFVKFIRYIYWWNSVVIIPLSPTLDLRTRFQLIIPQVSSSNLNNNELKNKPIKTVLHHAKTRVVFWRWIEEQKKMDNRKTLRYLAFITKLLWSTKASTVCDHFQDLKLNIKFFWYYKRYFSLSCIIDLRWHKLSYVTVRMIVRN